MGIKIEVKSVKLWDLLVSKGMDQGLAASAIKANFDLVVTPDGLVLAQGEKVLHSFAEFKMSACSALIAGKLGSFTEHMFVQQISAQTSAYMKNLMPPSPKEGASIVENDLANSIAKDLAAGVLNELEKHHGVSLSPEAKELHFPAPGNPQDIKVSGTDLASATDVSAFDLYTPPDFLEKKADPLKKNISVTKAIPLSKADKLYQVVKGTDTTSRYVVVAVSEPGRFNVAARLLEGKLSLRVEPTLAGFTPTMVDSLQKAGFTVGSSGGSHYSVHMDVGTDMVYVLSCLGAMLYRIGHEYTQQPSDPKKTFNVIQSHAA